MLLCPLESIPVRFCIIFREASFQTIKKILVQKVLIQKMTWSFCWEPFSKIGHGNGHEHDHGPWTMVHGPWPFSKIGFPFLFPKSVSPNSFFSKIGLSKIVYSLNGFLQNSFFHVIFYILNSRSTVPRGQLVRSVPWTEKMLTQLFGQHRCVLFHRRICVQMSVFAKPHGDLWSLKQSLQCHRRCQAGHLRRVLQETHQEVWMPQEAKCFVRKHRWAFLHRRLRPKLLIHSRVLAHFPNLPVSNLRGHCRRVGCIRSVMWATCTDPWIAQKAKDLRQHHKFVRVR